MKRENRNGLLDTWRNGRKGVAGVLVATLLLVMGGCYGEFPLTNKVYTFNREISHYKIIQTGTFWVFVIVPVYGIGIIADAIIFNLVEFWSDEQLLAIGPITDPNGNTISLTRSLDGQQAILTITRDGKVLAQEFFTKVSNTTFEVRNSMGELHGRLQKCPDGTISLTDRDASTVRMLPQKILSGL